jgi:hypothetical protein
MRGTCAAELLGRDSDTDDAGQTVADEKAFFAAFAPTLLAEQ